MDRLQPNSMVLDTLSKLIQRIKIGGPAMQSFHVSQVISGGQPGRRILVRCDEASALLLTEWLSARPHFYDVT